MQMTGVGESGWYFNTSPLRGSANIHHYLPPPQWIIVKYVQKVVWTRVVYINNSLHLARKYAGIFVRGHYLFREANSFPRAKLEENCELRKLWARVMFLKSSSLGLNFQTFNHVCVDLEVFLFFAFSFSWSTTISLDEANRLSAILLFVFKFRASPIVSLILYFITSICTL